MNDWTRPLLGFRLFALSVIVGSAAFLPSGSATRDIIVPGAAAALAAALGRFAIARWQLPVPPAVGLLVHLALWSGLAHLSGGMRSPFIIGFLFEIPLAALHMGPPGAAIAFLAGTLVFGLFTWAHTPPALDALVIGVGGLGIAALVSCFLVDAIHRQQRIVNDALAMLRLRSETVSDELRQLSDYLGDALFVIDDRGRVENMNASAARMCGITREQAAGRAWQEVLHCEPEGRRAILRTLVDGVTQREVGLVIEDRESRGVSVRAEMWMRTGQEGRRYYILLDPQAHAGVTHDPLRRLGESVACVSHQIRNSIQALQGLAAHLESPTGAKSAESACELRSILQGLGSITDDLLTMSGPPRDRDESVALHEVVSSALVLARCSAVQLRIAEPGGKLRVKGHRGELVHALFNLIDNAGGVSPAGAPVCIRVRDGRTHAVVEIEDRGPGMPAGADASLGMASARSGHGYGVFAARRFIEYNGGELSFHSMPRGGTRCRIRLRVAGPPVALDLLPGVA